MQRRGVGAVQAIVCLVALVAIGACSSSSSTGFGKHKGNLEAGAFIEGGLHFGGNGDGGNIVITPANPTISVNPEGPSTPVQFQVTGAGNAQIGWEVSNSSLGTIDATGKFTPSGLAAGQGDVEVTINGNVVAKVHIVVVIKSVQNGAAATPANADAGAGGLGGVGGEGLGGKIPDALVTTLQGTPTADATISWIYPYDQTVFPLGLLSPLFQWTAGSHGNFDAVYVHLSAPPYYDYKGFFGRPAALAAGANFLRSPIPQDVWKGATLSAAGSTLTVELVLAAGGKAYGKLTQNYKIALAPINGRIYYQAYDTAFVANSIVNEGGTIWDKSRFGAATLSIDVGADSPKLVAGSNGDVNGSGCRVCHSVSAYGDRMVVQHGDAYDQTSSYDLKNGNREAQPYQAGTVGWAGMSPDGLIGLANSIGVTGSTSNTGNTALYNMVTGAVIPSTGLTTFATKIGLPVFSPDGKHVAFTFFDGPGTAAIKPDGRTLVSMDFNLATKTFSNPKVLWRNPGATAPIPGANAEDQRSAFLTFTPSSDAVVFQRRWDGNGDIFSSWNGTRSELWWVDLATGTAKALTGVNGVGTTGKSYLPTGPKNHANDETLNYDPSISPVASGGYAWMVFMSRRMYGNIATRDPWESDPRKVDIHGDDPTTKKLWMAAIDLNAKPGTDPSHPAFYIPGQELHGVNSRPFFALQPCLSDEGVCATGVDCCSGFCRNGLCQAPPVNQCSQLNEKCTQSSDCCDVKLRCIGGFCANFVQ